jgi:CheY-like chemotaxis protein
MADQPEAPEAFVHELRHALRHLYDPAELRTSPLLALLAVEKSHDPVSALRRLLVDAIQALNPGPKAPVHSNARRIYHALSYRYIEQIPPDAVADSLGIGVRHLQRLAREAEQILADYLWDRYQLEPKADSLAPSTSPADDQATQPEVSAASREQELQWLKDSFPSEIINVAEVISATRRIIKPLVQTHNAQVEWNLPEHLPPVCAQLTPVRQALLNLLVAALYSAPLGRVELTVATGPLGIEVRVQATGDPAAGVPPLTKIGEHLDMARQFVGLFGGRLVVERQPEGEPSLVAAILLPVATQILVLVIDDNPDTLRLIQRYLSGTRYRFLGARDPEQALDLAETQSPQIIVLDVMLPGVDDWELLDRLSAHPLTRAVPIVICTILPQEELALSLGAAAFIRKPVSRATLLAALDRQVSLSSKEAR